MTGIVVNNCQELDCELMPYVAIGKAGIEREKRGDGQVLFYPDYRGGSLACPFK